MYRSCRDARFPLPYLCVITLLAALFILPATVFATNVEDPKLWTFSPLFEYRTDPANDYKSLNIFGPIIKYEHKENMTDRALRPLFFLSTEDEREALRLDVLFPLFTYKHDDEAVSYRLFFIINYYSNNTDDYSQRNFSLFPLLFYKKKGVSPRQYAVFPFIGHYFNWLKRDEVTYYLFPVYSHTKRNGTYVDNYLWPFFARISGDTPGETGFKIWPLYGRSQKPGVYRKSMFLWPFWMSEDLQQDSVNPISIRYSFPFYLYSETPVESRRTLFWPFFSYVDDRKKGYTEWNFPWPIFSYSRGDYQHGYRALPFISDMTGAGRRTRHFLWPLLKLEEHKIDTLIQQRTRVLFLLYTDLDEKEIGAEQSRRHRTMLWPLFGYRQEKGVSHFYALALLEPIFQQSDGLIRNWSPLWRIYQKKWDQQGNSVSSVLWNLYWHERSSEGVAWELFPIFSYKHEAEEPSEWAVLKGLVSVKNKDNLNKLHVLYLPWGISLGQKDL